ncbi:hypothetical protein VTI28DRAFT_4843 [Corynascus sepedonium]
MPRPPLACPDGSRTIRQYWTSRASWRRPDSLLGPAIPYRGGDGRLTPSPTVASSSKGSTGQLFSAQELSNSLALTSGDILFQQHNVLDASAKL